jgi:hypothetical protein
MQFAVERDLNRYDFLNRGYLKNRVFRNYARKHQLRFIDLAVDYPQDPAPTDDAIHFRYPGIVLEAWTLLQHLMRIIDDGIAPRRLPRAQQVVRAVHPGFDQASPRLVRFDSLQVRCH